MENYASVELQIFLVCTLFGTLSGMFYDVLAIRKKRITKKFFKDAADLIYWLFNVFIVVFLCFYTDEGLRLYEFAALLCGVILYCFLLRKHFVKVLTAFDNVLCFIIKFCLKTVLFPIILFVKLINKIFFAFRPKILKKKSKIQLTLRKFCFKIRKKLVHIFRFKRKG